MDATALPGRSNQDLGDCLLVAEVAVRGDEVDAAEAAVDELTQEGAPELEVLGRTDINSDHLRI